MQVLLLTQEQCGFCEQAREILEHLKSEYDLTIVTLDVRTSEGEALAARYGLLFPPGILLDEEPFSYGRLSERKLRREIERRRQDSKPRQRWFTNPDSDASKFGEP